MAKGKDRPAVAAKSGGARTPGSRPTQTRSPARSAPDAPPSRPAEGRGIGNNAAKLSPEEVYKLIQESAYFRAKARGFAPGHEVQDWIEAEAEVRRRLEGRAT